MRYLIGHETDGPVYRICQISGTFSCLWCVISISLTFKLELALDFVKPYMINNNKMINQAFELTHGRSAKIFTMDKVSNGPFLEVGSCAKTWFDFYLTDLWCRKSMRG